MLGERRLVNVLDKPFDPKTDVTFRGRKIEELTREELIEALTQALQAVKALDSLRY